MNEGYFSYIAVTLTAILVWTGWGGLVSSGFSGKSVTAFLLLWIAFSFVRWNAFEASGTFVYIPLLLLFLYAAASASWSERFSIVSFGMLLAAVHSLIELINLIDPFVLFVHPLLDPAFVVSVLSVAYSRKGNVQLALIAFALIMNDVYMALLYKEYIAPVFGGRVFQDEWWMTAAMTRATALIYTFLSVYAFSAIQKLLKMRSRNRP